MWIGNVWHNKYRVVQKTRVNALGCQPCQCKGTSGSDMLLFRVTDKADVTREEVATFLWPVNHPAYTEPSHLQNVSTFLATIVPEIN